MFEMSFDHPLVEAKFRGLERTISEHLVKLLAFDAPDHTRSVWKKEIRNHLLYLSRLRAKSNNKPIPAKSIWKWLYTDPFEHNEVGVVEGYVMMYEDDFKRNTLHHLQIAERIKSFYWTISQNLAKGDASPETINTL